VSVLAFVVACACTGTSLCCGAVVCKLKVWILAGTAPSKPAASMPHHSPEFVLWREQRRLRRDYSSVMLMGGRQRRRQSWEDSEEQPGEYVPRCALGGDWLV
jgi:hypothetical protein